MADQSKTARPTLSVYVRLLMCACLVLNAGVPMLAQEEGRELVARLERPIEGAIVKAVRDFALVGGVPSSGSAKKEPKIGCAGGIALVAVGLTVAGIATRQYHKTEYVVENNIINVQEK